MLPNEDSFHVKGVLRNVFALLLFVDIINVLIEKKALMCMLIEAGTKLRHNKLTRKTTLQGLLCEKIYTLYLSVINRTRGTVEHGYHEHIYNEFMLKAN